VVDMSIMQTLCSYGSGNEGKKKERREGKKKGEKGSPSLVLTSRRQVPYCPCDFLA